MNKSIQIYLYTQDNPIRFLTILLHDVNVNYYIYPKKKYRFIFYFSYYSSSYPKHNPLSKFDMNGPDNLSASNFFRVARTFTDKLDNFLRIAKNFA